MSPPIQVRLRNAPAPAPSLCIDLENRPLAYWYDGNPTSEITAFGWKWSNEKRVHTMLLRSDGWFDVDGDGWPAESAYRWFRAQLAEAALVYGHNIRRHDLPMFNAGLFRRSLPVLPPLMTCDTFKDLPRTAGVSKSLENMAAMYGLPGKKHRMTQPAWEEANRLTDGGIDLARKRVVSDVLLQERLRDRLRSLGILKPPRAWRP